MKLAKLMVLCASIMVLPASGSTATGSVQAQAIVSAGCSLTGGSLNFGNYNPIIANAHTPLNGTGTFTIVCTKGATATLSLDQGSNSAHASGTSRAMSMGSNYLSYELYTSSSYSTVWSTVNTVNYVSSSKNNINTETIWGKIPAGQNVRADLTYTDMITVTANF